MHTNNDNNDIIISPYTPDVPRGSPPASEDVVYYVLFKMHVCNFTIV